MRLLAASAAAEIEGCKAQVLNLNLLNRVRKSKSRVNGVKSVFLLIDHCIFILQDRSNDRDRLPAGGFEVGFGGAFPSTSDVLYGTVNGLCLSEIHRYQDMGGCLRRHPSILLHAVPPFIRSSAEFSDGSFSDPHAFPVSIGFSLQDKS